jgi:MSHA pilin protein MshC
MVELIVVMVLIGILGTIAANRFFDRGAFDSVSFADQAAAALRFAQKAAIAQNRPVYVRFNGQSISLCFDTSAPCDAVHQVLAPFSVSTDSTDCTSATWYCIRRPATMTYTVSLGAVSLSGSRYAYFDALGRPFIDSAGTQTTGMTLDIAGNGSSAQVNVAPETGYVY